MNFLVFDFFCFVDSFFFFKIFIYVDVVVDYGDDVDMMFFIVGDLRSWKGWF